jgi:hypothetical protein
MTLSSLISTGLQPRVPAGEEPSRFNGLAPVSGLKPLKRFQPRSSPPTRLKPGANEMARLAIGNCHCRLLLSTP